MVEIGNMPILRHIMKIYAGHGLTDFVICCGYTGHVIKKYFLDFFHREGDFTTDLATSTVEVDRPAAEQSCVSVARRTGRVFYSIQPDVIAHAESRDA